MRQKMTFMILAAVALLVGAGSGSVWAQDALQLTADATQVTQNFDGMWDSEAQAATLDMPQGWRVERQMNAPRTVGSYANAATTVMYTGGTSLASNAKNGTWNFASSSVPSDCSVGGLSTRKVVGHICWEPPPRCVVNTQNLTRLVSMSSPSTMVWFQRT